MLRMTRYPEAIPPDEAGGLPESEADDAKVPWARVGDGATAAEAVGFGEPGELDDAFDEPNSPDVLVPHPATHETTRRTAAKRPAGTPPSLALALDIESLYRVIDISSASALRVVLLQPYSPARW